MRPVPQLLVSCRFAHLELRKVGREEVTLWPASLFTFPTGSPLELCVGTSASKSDLIREDLLDIDSILLSSFHK